MKLNPPFIISSRLMPAIHAAGATLSLEVSERQTSDGRDMYDCWIDLPDGTGHEVTDLRSGCQGAGSVQEGMGTLLLFLVAAAESRQHRERTGMYGENEDLFSPAIVDWAAANSDELSMLAVELEETPNLVTEED